MYTEIAKNCKFVQLENIIFSKEDDKGEIMKSCLALYGTCVLFPRH